MYKLLVDHVCFVANKHTLDILSSIGVLLQLADPVAHIVETVLIRAIICKHCSLSILKIILSNVSIALLASSVPNLKLDVLAIELNVLDLKINSDCRYERRGEVLVGEFQKDARFADSGVPNRNDADFIIDCLVFQAKVRSSCRRLSTRRAQLLGCH